MPRSSSLIDTLASLTNLPFKGAPVVVWLLFVALWALDPNAPVWQGHLWDPDNYLYLVQAIDQINGQNWFDLVQHRMNPPEGTLVHYSHLLSGFYAIIIFLLKPFLGLMAAALATAALLPCIYLALFLFVLRRMARIVVDKEWGDLSAYLIYLSPAAIYRFLPGIVDHHGLVVLLSVAAFTGMAQMVFNPSALKHAALAGATLAFMLALALESTAIIFFFCLCLGAWAVVEGGAAARSGGAFGASFLLGCLAVLLATRAPSHYFDINVLAYSIVYVYVAAAVAVCFAGVALAGTSRRLRVITGAALAFAGGGLLLFFFPELRQGPYGGMDPALAKLIFAVAPESWPVIRADGIWAQQGVIIIWALLTLGANAFLFLKETNRARRWLWGMVFVVLAGALSLALFSQCRMMIYAQTFALLPIAAIIKYDKERSLSAVTAKRRFHAARVGLFLFIVPVLAVASAGFPVHPSAKSVSTSPAHPASPIGCDMRALADVLNDKQKYGDRPRLIMNSINEGPELLFRTAHSVLAGPYHTNVSGNLDAQRFFSASDPNEAKMFARKRQAELVVICSRSRQLLGYGGGENEPGRAKTPFVQQLIDKKIPRWLTPVESPSFGDLMLFEIHVPHTKQGMK